MLAGDEFPEAVILIFANKQVITNNFPFKLRNMILTIHLVHIFRICLTL